MNLRYYIHVEKCTLKSKNNFSFQQRIMLFLVLKLSTSRSGSFGAYLVKNLLCSFYVTQVMHNPKHFVWHTFIWAYSTVLLSIYFRVHSQRERTLAHCIHTCSRVGYGPVWWTRSQGLESGPVHPALPPTLHLMNYSLYKTPFSGQANR